MDEEVKEEMQKWAKDLTQDIFEANVINYSFS